jgi:hypothetical protein
MISIGKNYQKTYTLKKLIRIMRKNTNVIKKTKKLLSKRKKVLPKYIENEYESNHENIFSFIIFVQQYFCCKWY